MRAHHLKTLFFRSATAVFGCAFLCAYACAQPPATPPSSSTNTSVPVSIAGGTTDRLPNTAMMEPSASAATGGILLSLERSPTKCLGVDSIAAGANVILRACDGNSATLWTLTSGQLRLNNVLCLDVASATPGATTLDPTATFSVAVCDQTRTAQRIELGGDGGLGPNLGNTSYAISVTSPVTTGSPTYPVLRGNTAASKWFISSTKNNAPGIGGFFALRFADNPDACIILDSTRQPAVQSCSSASNVWWYSSLGSFTDGKSNCLNVNTTSGKIGLVACDGKTDRWGTYGAQLVNKITGSCIAFAPPIFGSSTVLMSNCANQEGQFFTLAPIY